MEIQFTAVNPGWFVVLASPDGAKITLPVIGWVYISGEADPVVWHNIKGCASVIRHDDEAYTSVGVNTASWTSTLVTSIDDPRFLELTELEL